jgi:hypothetical protein
MFPIRFFNNKACNWSLGFLQIVNISKLYHILGSNHSTFYVWSFQVSFPYKILVLKMRTLLLMKYMWKTITFHCLPSLRWWYVNFRWFCCETALGLHCRKVPFSMDKICTSYSLFSLFFIPLGLYFVKCISPTLAPCKFCHLENEETSNNQPHSCKCSC